MAAEPFNRPPSAASSDPSFGSSAAASATGLKERVAGELDRGKAGIVDSASAAREGLSEDLSKLRADVARIQETLSKFVGEAGGEAARTARGVSGAVASEVGEVASDFVEAGKEQVKTFASELEDMARRNPLGTLAGTLLVGVVIGLMTRGRS